MYTVYVLRSLKTSKRYVGSSSKTASARTHDHNSGTNKWTRGHRPLQLKYQEKFSTLREARQREKFLKSGQGRKFLDSINV